MKTHYFRKMTQILALIGLSVMLSAHSYAAVTSPANSEATHVVSVMGKMKTLKFGNAVTRVAVGDPSIADFRSISDKEIYVLGKAVGSTNLIVWFKDGQTEVMDISVVLDLSDLQRSIKAELASETDIKVTSTGNSIVLSGSVADTVKATVLMNITEAHLRNLNRAFGSAAPAAAGAAGGATPQAANIQIINTVKVRDPQQVMLEVRIAEISKTLVDQLGVSASLSGGGSTQWSVTGITGAGNNLLSLINNKGINKSLSVKGQKSDGLVKVLAEPNIVAMNGQEASFLVGGQVFLPVTQSAGVGGTAISLQQVDFGVGLKFVPTVLDGGRISLRVAPEVSEIGSPLALNSAGAAGTSSSVTLPTFNTNRVSTTVQLNDGQSLVIGGLLKNNVKESLDAFPFLGELPILGALFRSSSFQNDKTELVIVVSPKLVRPTNQAPALPTDNFVEPGRLERYLGGKLEGTKKTPSVDLSKDSASSSKPASSEIKSTAEPSPVAGQESTGNVDKVDVNSGEQNAKQ